VADGFRITDEQDRQLENLLAAVRDERIEQERKFPDQHLPNGTGEEFRALADQARVETDLAAEQGTVTWRHVLTEEFWEALAEEGSTRLRAELIQVAAVALRWAQDL
jgi:hypothetical protein